jgi:hypothetical protein
VIGMWGNARWLLGLAVASILAVGVAAQNAPAAPLDVTCAPRTPVNVSTTAVPGNPGNLQATISVTGTGNTITALRFDDPRPSVNATLDVGGQAGRSGAFVYTPPANSTTVAITIRPVAQGQAATVNLTVADGCGDWPTIIGGGAGAIPVPTSTPTNGPSPTRTPTITPTPSATLVGGVTCTSTLSVSGQSWSDPSVWSPTGVPGASSDVCIPAGRSVSVTDGRTVHSLHAFGNVAISGGSLDLAAASELSGQLVMDGTLSGAGDLRVSGTFGWAGGTLSGSGALNVLNAATMNILGTGDKSLSEKTVNNAGTITWTTGTLNGNTGGTINNSGLFDVQGDVTMQNNDCCGRPFSLNNLASGTVRKSASNGTTTITGVTLNNAGTFAPQTGTLALAVDGTSVGGTFSPASGTMIRFTGNTHTINGVTFSGAGTNQIAGATIAATSTNTVQNLDFASGTISGAGDLAVTSGGTLRWTGGTMGDGTTNGSNPVGTTTVQSGGTLAISGAGSKGISGRTIVNNGTTTWAGTGSIDGSVLGVFSNANGGLFDAQADAMFHTTDCCGRAPSFNNLTGSTFRKSAGTSTVFADTTWHMSGGTVNIQAGALTFPNGATASGGTFGAGAGTTQVTGGNFDVTNTPTIGSGGSFTLPTGGNITGPGDLSVASGGTLNWTGGTMSGTLDVNNNPIGTTTVQSGGALAISGAQTKTFSARTVVNNGTATWTDSGDVGGSVYGVFTNNGNFNIQNDVAFHDSDCCGRHPTFNNGATGTLRKQTGAVSPAKTSFSGLTFNDSGFTTINAGTLQVNDVNGQYVKTAGTLGLDAGTTVMSNGTDGGAVVIEANAALAGSGTVLGSVTNRGSVNPGGFGPSAIGTLNVTGNYYQEQNGKLVIKIAGAGAGQMDLLYNPSGNAPFASTEHGTSPNTLIQIVAENGYTLDPNHNYIFMDGWNIAGYWSFESGVPYFMEIGGVGGFRMVTKNPQVDTSAPANDNFELDNLNPHQTGRQFVGAPPAGYFLFNIGATVEGGETTSYGNCGGLPATVQQTTWFSYTVPNGAANLLRVLAGGVTAGGTDFFPVVSVYQFTPAGLAKLDDQRTLSDIQPYLDGSAHQYCSQAGLGNSTYTLLDNVPVTQGTTYLIQVSSPTTGPGAAGGRLHVAFE